MNDLQIEYFLTVAKNLSFTKAAAELYVTQPAVSRQISVLEKELGVALFDRTNKETLLTEAGHLYVRLFTDFQQRLQEVKYQTQEANAQRRGVIRLGCLEGWDITGFFPDVLGKFKKDYPNVQVILECFGIRGLVHALKTDGIDAAMSIDVTLMNIDDIYTETLTSIPRIILYSTQHALSGKPGLRPQDFSNETFFVLSSEEASYAADLVRGYLRPFGFEPHIQLVRNIESMNACVHNGMGVAVSDWWSSAKNMPDFRFIPIGSRHPISLVWKKKNKNDIIRILANELKFTLEQQLDV